MPAQSSSRQLQAEANPRNRRPNGNATKSGESINAAVVQATVPQWLSLTLMLSLIFGGCCSNVLALEALIREVPGSGTLITFTQFFLTALLTLPNYVSLSRGIKNLYLKERAIPFQRWVIYTAFFLSINLLNNKAFGYKISLPLHIILRSAGPVSSMFVGFLFGKRYRTTQILAVFLLFIGVVVAAIADAQAKGSKISLFVTLSDTPEETDSSTNNSATGFVLLFLALMISAIMGVFTDRTYSRYGRNHWGENLLYSHLLSIPVFLWNYNELKLDFTRMLFSAPISMYMSPTASPASNMFISNVQSVLPKSFLSLPSHVVFLVLNAMTQYVCIRGVNLLSAKSSSLTVTIVLNVRKLVSLVLSIWLFGNQLSTGVMLGAAVVFAGAGLYALPAKKPNDAAKANAAKLKERAENGESLNGSHRAESPITTAIETPQDQGSLKRR